jgi:hypothetical protein
MKIILTRSVKDSDIPRARELLYGYLTNFSKVRNHIRRGLTTKHRPQLHPDCVKPNFHWLTHIFDQIADYGSVYNFWTFTYERLNKVLKSYATNNHVGEIEVTFFRAFM